MRPHTTSRTTADPHRAQVRTAAAALLVLLPALVEAATLTVTSLANAGPGSLRQAVVDASAGDTIEFTGTLEGRIVLATPILIDRSLIVRGRPGIVLDGNDLTRVIAIQPGVDATLVDLTIRRGFAPFGAGIYSLGTLTLRRCRVQDNHAITQGGGIHVDGGSFLIDDSDITDNEAFLEGGGLFDRSSGTAVIVDSRFTANQSNVSGGGIRHVSTRRLVIARSTISGNIASGGGTPVGGGISSVNGTLDIHSSVISSNRAYFGGGIIVERRGAPSALNLANSLVLGNSATSDGGGVFMFGSTLSATNSTIADNVASLSFGGGLVLQNSASGPAVAALTHVTVAYNRALSASGGIRVISGSLTLRNTVVGGNAAPIDPDLNSAIISLGYNLVQQQGSSSGYLATDFADGTNPRLAVTGYNGGPTNTIRLEPDSPAVNAVPAALCADIVDDQRGFTRPGGGCDIGAYEIGAVPPPESVFANGYEN